MPQFDIQLENVFVKYENINKNIFKNRSLNLCKIALSDINLQISNGEFLGITGPNGAGKSTLLRVLAGVLKPSKGNVFINSSLKIGSLLNLSAGINPDCSVRDNIFRVALFKGHNYQDINKSISKIFDFSEIAKKNLEIPFRTLSDGMKVRILFSINTFWNYDILILDELLSVGDWNFKIKAKQRMNELLRASSIVLLASHDLDLINTLSNKRIEIDNGKIINNYKNPKKIKYI